MKIVILLFLSFGLSAKDCSTIENDIARLDCYDKVVKKKEKEAGKERDYIAEAREKIKEQLKDPFSAKFRNEVIFHNSDIESGIGVCGEVNAKNSYGAYGGFERYYYSFGKKAETVSSAISEGVFDVLWDLICKNKD